MAMRKFALGAFVASFGLLAFGAEPVSVSTVDELASAIASDPAAEIVLANDLSAQAWTSCAFSGTFDGAGHTITGLGEPLFTTLTGSVTVKDVTFNACSFNDTGATNDIGIVALTASGDATEVVFSGLRFVACSLQRQGGSVGMVLGRAAVFSLSAADCTVDSTCQMSGSKNVSLGGLFGSVTVSGQGARAAFERCEAAPSVTFGNATHYFGGIVYSATCKGSGGGEGGFAYLSFTDCTNRTSITSAKSNSSFGGIVYSASCGDSNHMGEITFLRCVNYGSFAGTGGVTTSANIGGIAATASNARMTFDSCVNYGDLSSTGAGDTRICIGGIVGGMGNPIKQTARIFNCANLGDLDGYYAGGIVGSIAHNASYSSNQWLINSCLQRGELSCRAADEVPGEAIGRLASGLAFPKVDCSGSLFRSSTLIGSRAEGASVTSLVDTDTVYADASDGLVDGGDLARLNAYGDNLWKQGYSTPILKLLADEPAPDTIIVEFVDAEAFGSTLVKRCVISRGGTAIAPAAPEHDGYTFVGWAPETFSGLTDDTTVVATYQVGVLEYTVCFYDWDGAEIGEAQTVAYGEAAVAPADPTREGYVFIGWNREFDEVMSDLDVTAVYTVGNVDIATAEDLALLAEARYAKVVYHLTEDVTLPADWEPVDFVAQLDCGGHRIVNASGKPLFARLAGSFADAVVDGWNPELGKATQVTVANSTEFGFVAVTVDGGRIADVTLENCELKTGDNSYEGLIAATMRDGAVLDRVATDSSCRLYQKKCAGAGGLVGRFTRTDAFAPKDADGKDLAGETLCAILNSTNAAPIVTYGNGSSRVGGILGSADVGNETYRFALVVSNCVNLADFTASYAADDAGSFGGIVGGRVNNNSGDQGVLHVIDCENDGDIAAAGKTGSYGGIVGYLHRGSRTVCRRSVNRGDIGGETAFGGVAVTGGSAGGVIGFVSDLYAGNPHSCIDCANYGRVTGGAYAGGVFGRVSANNGHSHGFEAVNSANYGEVATVAEGGVSGEVFAAFLTDMAVGTCTITVSNTFTVAEGVYGAIAEQTDPTHVKLVFGGNVTAADETYAVRKATLALADWADGNGQTTWVQGQVGDTVYPELEIFRLKPPYPGFRLHIR